MCRALAAICLSAPQALGPQADWLVAFWCGLVPDGAPPEAPPLRSGPLMEGMQTYLWQASRHLRSQPIAGVACGLYEVGGYCLQYSHLSLVARWLQELET